MKPSCPYCLSSNHPSDSRPPIIKRGHFRRKSDSRFIQNFYCRSCSKYFSRATGHPAYRQKKRNLNHRLKELLVSGVSMRRSARLLHLSRTTVARKLIYLGSRAKVKLEERNHAQPLAEIVEFDDQETFEHTKCKPLSITIAVEHKTRRILGFEVAQMNAKGKLAEIGRKKYGRRKDTRYQARKRLFRTLTSLVISHAHFKSDENPHYLSDLKKHFPNSTHQMFKGQRGSIVGQGELKAIRFDPLFSINHTCAMTRANMSRLMRKTWCTTKSQKSLSDHFAIYADYHNEMLSA